MNCAIGIDIGGTKIALGLVDGEGRILARRELAVTALPDFAAAVAGMAAMVAELRTTAGDRPVAGIGIGAPGPLDTRSGIIDDPHTLPVLSGQSITRALGEACGLDIRLENDADAALLGEVWVGSARGCRHAAMLTVGTGVGGAVLVDGRLLRGADGAHPEIGHVPGADRGPSCYCGLSGCLESLASGSAIASAGLERGFPTAAAVFAAAQAGDTTACTIVEGAVQACCRGLWTLVHAYHPEVVIWGGGVLGRHFRQHFASELERAAHAAGLGRIRPVAVRPAALGNDAGLVGAASLSLQPHTREEPRSSGFSLAVCRDHEELSHRALAVVTTLLAGKPDALLCLPTGATPTRFYELLAEQHRRDGCAARARLVKLDEWGGLPPGHPGTCEAYLRRHVLDPLAIAPERYLGFDGEAPDPDAECARIGGRLARLPPFDLCILGLGANGHLALIEPGSSLAPGPHVAHLSPQSLRHPMLGGADGSALFGLTLGAADLLRSRRILLLVSGAGKAEVFRRLRNSGIDTALPASLLLAHPDVLCLCDTAAMGGG